MKKIVQGIFILILFIPMMLWFIMSFQIHKVACMPTDLECREDALNAKITNIN